LRSNISVAYGSLRKKDHSRLPANLRWDLYCCGLEGTLNPNQTLTPNPKRCALTLTLNGALSQMKRSRAYRAPAYAYRAPAGRRVRARRGPPRQLALRGRRAGFLRRGGYYGRYTPGAGEQKFFDTTRAAAAAPIAGIIANLSLNLIPQGVTESERVGRKCTVTRIYIQGQFLKTATSTAADADDTIRMIVYLDKQANGATAAVTDILETATINSFNNLSNSSRFKTLAVKRMSINAIASFAAGTVNVQEDWTCAIKCNIPIEFSAATGAIAEVRSNNIGILMISDEGLAFFQYTARIRFSDT